MQEEPKKTPFKVAYEVYRDPRKGGYFARRRRDVLTDDSPPNQNRTRRTLNFFGEDSSSSEELEMSEEAKNKTNKEKYKLLKKYFEDKSTSLSLKNPLIFYDDNAMRIDIGYGPKEFPVLFPELSRAFKAKNKGDIVFHHDYERELEKERDRLLEIAAHVIKDPLPSKPKALLDPQLNTEEGLIENLLTASRGLVVGEIHEHSGPKRFLIDHMKTLADMGVTRIYMEHLLDRHQALLDEKELPQELALYLKNLDEGHDVKENYLKDDENAGTFLNVVKAAKKQGIRIIAIDSEATYAIGGAKNYSELLDENSSTGMRYKIMNMAMLERFKQHDDGSKYIVFVGSGHASTSHHVPGVSELLGCPNLIIHDVDEEHQTATLEIEVDYEKDTEDATHYDFLYHRDNTLKEFQQSPKVLKQSAKAR